MRILLVLIAGVSSVVVTAGLYAALPAPAALVSQVLGAAAGGAWLSARLEP